MSGTAILTQIVTILVGGLKAIGEGIGEALSDMVQAIFIYTPDSGTAGLSTFANILVVFAAVALGLSLTRWVLNFITSFGQRNR